MSSESVSFGIPERELKQFLDGLGQLQDQGRKPDPATFRTVMSVIPGIRILDNPLAERTI